MIEICVKVSLEEPGPEPPQESKKASADVPLDIK